MHQTNAILKLWLIFHLNSVADDGVMNQVCKYIAACNFIIRPMQESLDSDRPLGVVIMSPYVDCDFVITAGGDWAVDNWKY